MLNKSSRLQGSLYTRLNGFAFHCYQILGQLLETIITKYISMHRPLDMERFFFFTLNDLFGLIFSLLLLVGFVKIVSKASNEENSPCQYPLWEQLTWIILFLSKLSSHCSSVFWTSIFGITNEMYEYRLYIPISNICTFFVILVSTQQKLIVIKKREIGSNLSSCLDPFSITCSQDLFSTHRMIWGYLKCRLCHLFCGF